MSQAGLPGSPASRARIPLRAVLPLALAALAACGGGDDREPLVLGLAVPLTDTQGNDDVYGVHSRIGAELAVREINDAGGIDGRPLELRIVNDRGDPTVASTVADSLVDDERVLAVVGHVYSGATREAAARYHGNVAALATSATSPAISRLGPWIFRVASSDSANAVRLAEMARRMGRRIGVLYANDEYGRGLATNFIAALRAGGATVVEADPFLDDTGDFTPYLRRMQGRGVDLVFLAGLQDPAARAISQARRVGLDARFVGGDGIEGLAGMEGAFDGTGVGLLFHPQMSDSSRAFAARYRAAQGGDPDSQAALAYDAVRLMARALAAGRRDPEGIRDYLAGVGRPGGTPAFQGVAGEVQFDENGDPVNKAFTLGVIQGGRIVLPSEAR